MNLSVWTVMLYDDLKYFTRSWRAGSKQRGDEYEWMDMDETINWIQWRDQPPVSSRKHETERWKTRYKERIEFVKSFGETCVNLLRELEKIDGAASAREHNTFNRSASKYDVDRFIHMSSYNADPNSEAEFFRTKVCFHYIGMVPAHHV